MIEFFTSPEAWLSLLTLTILEIVLGVDNIIFISIITSKLPRIQQLKGRRIGTFGKFKPQHFGKDCTRFIFSKL